MWSRAPYLVLGAWLGLGIVFAGIGLLACRLLRVASRGSEGWLRAFWVGWVSAVFGLQLWHLVLPVDLRALATAAAIGVVGLVAGSVSGGAAWLRVLAGRGAGRRALFAAALAILATWIALLALDGPMHGDSGAYFVPTVRWVADHAIVPGLANLYVPYGFNQSYFLYVAMLDTGPLAHRAYHVANGLLVLALLARTLLGVHRLLRPERPCSPADVFYALFLPVTLWLAQGIFLISPSPDLPVFVLGVVLSGELVALLSRPSPDPVLLAIVLIATGGVTVKLSFTGLAGATIAVALLAALIRDRAGMRTVAAVAGVIAAGMVPWVARNVVLSGRPFYPSAFGALPVPWGVDADAVQWIVKPMEFGVPIWRAVLMPRWFLTRLDSLGWLDPNVLLPAAVTVAAIVVGLCVLCVRLLRRRPRAGRVSVVAVVPAVASLVFVAATAPMPHYAGATFWLIALGSVLVVIESAGWTHAALARRLVAGGVLVASCVVLSRARPLIAGPGDLAPAPTARVEEVRLRSGLVVRVPENSQCWDAPQPCTPSPDPRLRLRRDGDLGSGFVLDHGA